MNDKALKEAHELAQAAATRHEEASGATMAAADLLAFTAYFLAGDRPERVLAMGVTFTRYDGESYEGPKVPTWDEALDSFPYADLYLSVNEIEIGASVEEQRMAIALAAVTEARIAEDGGTFFCPELAPAEWFA